MKYAIIALSIVAALLVAAPAAYGFYQSIHNVANSLKLISN